ncbi:MAG: threonine/serine exporter family protein [Defluviitaleaceae bacterium]|nr:threonine/serine exporter family protein [Defluviitaleaceae bacterium]
MKELLSFVSNMAKTLATNGAETHRVEETVSYVVKHYTGKNGESIISPTTIICGIEDQRAGIIKRIDKRSINLTRVNMTISLSRQIIEDNLSLAEAKAKLDEINKMPNYSIKSLTLVAATGCASFAFLLGGGFLEAIFAFIISFFTRIILMALGKKDSNIFFMTMIGGIFTSIAAILISSIIHINTDILIIAAIMILVPGVPLTSAFRDILEGHYIAGNSRLMEALFIAFCLAIGVFVPLNIFYISGFNTNIPLIQLNINYNFFQMIILPATRLAPPQVVAALASSMCFAYIFGAPKKELILAGLTSSFGWLILELFGMIFLSAAAVSILSLFFSKKRKVIGSIYLIAGIIPYVPGAGIYRTMLYLVANETGYATAAGLETFAAAGSIALGIMVVYSIFNLIKRDTINSQLK